MGQHPFGQLEYPTSPERPTDDDLDTAIARLTSPLTRKINCSALFAGGYGWPSRCGQSRQDLDVPVGSVHADPLPIEDQPGGIYDTDDGRQAVLPCDHRAVSHQSSDLGH